MLKCCPAEMRPLNRPFSRGAAAALVVLVVGAFQAACGGSDDGAEQTLTLRVVTSPGTIEYDRRRLTARAGRIVFVLVNDKLRGHNIRIHEGDIGGLAPQTSEDLGGTETISTGRTRAILELEPGTYTYLCSAGGHWRTQYGRLVVR
jgi:plastocyanin